ncbi:hypothetical protein BDN71DRAFT_1456396 [Pleurotus eryngii]|uniref:Rhodopsin domain-containing protein n=1 Tax=Pleurotus eryngii TaxID=5323 RepID=A0A9P6D338_PLEER|nr:hypothetical protein BDN71DRAFT_1456396 [Pleurotus eryngii]
MSVPIPNVKVIALFLPILAILLTACRMLLQLRSRTFRVDDGWATFSSVGLFIFSVCTFVSLGHVGGATAVALDYLVSELFYTVLWSARLSILLSLAQPSLGRSTRGKTFVYSTASGFILFWIILFAQTFWVCETASEWKHSPPQRCPKSMGIAIAQLTTGVAANAALLVLPATFLFDASLTNKQRVHMICTIVATVFAAVASLVHGYFTLRVGGLPELVLAIIEASATLMACSAAILATAVLDLIKKPSPSDRWIMTSSFNTLSPTFSTDTVKTVHLSPRSGTSVSYEGNTPFRKSPSLWGPNGAGVHITEEKVSVLHFPTPAVLKRSV